MSRKSRAASSDLISYFTFEELLQQVGFDLRVKGFIVMNSSKNDHTIKLNMPYRADYYCMILVRKGSIGFTMKDQLYEIAAGDMIFCPKGETFWMDHLSIDYNAKYIFFSFDFISESGFNSIDVLKIFTSDPAIFIKNESDLFRKVVFHLEQLENLNNAEKNNYYFKEMIWHYFSLIIYEIDNYLKKTEKIKSISDREDEITTDFFVLVRKHFKEQHNVQFYADQLCISRKYLTSIINKTLRKSPKEIIDQVLILEARLLLKNSNSNITEVALQLNFPDQATFSKFFKRHTRKSPQEYKKGDLN